MENYTYKNCFKLANSTNNINNYFYDASNSNQPIQNENDCANYAYYNNHPSFFFKNNKDNSDDISKCFVFKYENINPNNNDIDKETQINNITNLNYDINNNRNLPRFNLKEEIEDSTGNAVDETTCNTRNNSLTYYLMKSFSNSYDINYNKITKRDKNNYVDLVILNEYKQYTEFNNPQKLSTFRSNFLIYQPTFNNLYTNNTYDANYMYYDMISLFINNTLYYSSNNGIPISVHNNGKHVLYKKNAVNDGPISTLTEPTDINQGMDPAHNGISFFKNNIKMYPSYIGLPIDIYKKKYGTNDIIISPHYYYEDQYHYYINLVFVIFLIVKSRDKLDINKNKTFVEFGNYVDGKDKYFEYNIDEGTNYSFTYANIHRALRDTSGGSKLFEFEATLYVNKIDLENAVNEFLYQLLCKKGETDAPDIKIKTKCANIKSFLYPDIIDKFLSTHDNNNFSSDYKYFDFKSFYGEFGYTGPINKYMNIFRKIYTGEHRLLAIEKFFKERQKILVNENNLIKQDINNMKTYIDNIYLHSKLNNIENYIYNEKSKLKYLFNKNSSEKQKNDDLKFLNNFILTENIIICIIIFILILFFIKK